MVTQLTIIKVYAFILTVVLLICIKAYLDSRHIIIKYRRAHYNEPRIKADPFKPSIAQRIINYLLTLKSSFK